MLRNLRISSLATTLKAKPFGLRNVSSVLVRKNAQYAMATQQGTALIRSCSTAPKNEQAAATEGKKHTSGLQKVDFDDYDDWEEPTTAKQKVAVYSTLFLRLAFLIAIGACAFYTAKELFPGRMNPNSLFSEIFDILRIKEQVQFIFHGGFTEQPKLSTFDGILLLPLSVTIFDSVYATL